MRRSRSTPRLDSAALAEGPVTATDAFYVRGHGAVPEIDPDAWRLHVHGLVERELDLSLVTLREAFQEREVTATLQCAGNRRVGLMRYPRTPGRGAVGAWRYRYRDVERRRARRRARARWPAARGGARGLRGCRSLPGGEARAALRWLDPARQGVSPGGPARLGDEWGAAPARPRCAAARGRARLHRRAQCQVARADRGPLKALGGATSSTSPIGCCREDGTPGPGAGMPLGLVALNADVLSPANGETVAAGPVEVRGYAFAGGERHVARVDVSVDGGASWSQAELLEDLGRWAWRQWRMTVDLAPGEHEILVRAWDSSAATQPEERRDTVEPEGLREQRPPASTRAGRRRLAPHAVAVGSPHEASFRTTRAQGPAAAYLCFARDACVTGGAENTPDSDEHQVSESGGCALPRSHESGSLGCWASTPGIAALDEKRRFQAHAIERGAVTH